MKPKSKIVNSAAVFLLLIFLFGCSEEILEEKPPHLLTTNTLYTSLEGMETGLNGLYSLARKHWGYNKSNARWWIWPRLGTDALCCWQPNGGLFAWIAFWGVHNNPQNYWLNEYFVSLYEVINAANTIINNAEKEGIDWSGGDASPSENKERVIAEASAIRAWAYRHLAFGWGDVPLNLEESSGDAIKTDWERMPVDIVKRQVINDFLRGEKSIPVEPIPGRMSKGAVQTYLSEMYLDLGKPDSALYFANQAINTPQYQLITERYGVNTDKPGVPYMDMFYDGNTNRQEGNTEALWVLQYDEFISGGSRAGLRNAVMSMYYNLTVNGTAPLQITQQRGGRGQARVALTKYALDLYEPRDDRFSHTAIRKYFILRNAEENAPIDADILPEGYNYGDTLWLDWSVPLSNETVQRYDWPYSRKYDWASNAESPKEKSTYNDHVCKRLAETYLLKAEAQLLLDRPGDAAETINVLRRRSNASEISAGDMDMDFILEERIRELGYEEDRRWTLIRLGLWVERTRAYNHFGGPNIAERDKLFPIPQAVIDANLTSEMPQNPGYQP